MKRLFAITGTPGTGKKTVAPLVASKLGVEAFGLNQLAEKWGLLEGEGEVDTERLKKTLSSELKHRAVVYGHLVPYSLRRQDLVRAAVLRCDPKVLRRRLEARGYGAEKIRSNVEAELIGLVCHESRAAYGDLVFEVDTSSATPEAVAASIARGFTGRAGGRRIDWSPDYDSSDKLAAMLR